MVGVSRYVRSWNDQSGVGGALWQYGPRVVGCDHRSGGYQSDAQRVLSSHVCRGRVETSYETGHQIIDRDNIPEVVRKAIKLLETEQPVACHIQLPEDMAKQKATNPTLPFHKVRRSGPDEKIIDQAITFIEQAKRPVMLTGDGAIRKRASQQLKHFAENIGIPVFNAFMGKGALARTDPHCLFTVRLQAKDYAVYIFEQADLVITVGCDLVEYHLRSRKLGQPKKILHIDFLQAEVDQQYPVEVEINADLDNALWKLNERLGRRSPRLGINAYPETRARILTDLAEHENNTATGVLKLQ